MPEAIMTWNSEKSVQIGMGCDVSAGGCKSGSLVLYINVLWGCTNPYIRKV